LTGQLKVLPLSVEAELRFFWDEVNEAEIAAHGVDKETAEGTVEGTVEGRLYRIAFSKTFPEGIRITTAFHISRKRRRT